MAHRRRSGAVLAVLVIAGSAGNAVAQGGVGERPVFRATATGNDITGGQSYAPASLTVPVGAIVVWRNTDYAAPHTVTERNALWELTGGYFGTPINPPGFGPGNEVLRAFEAGTHQYFCTVHPTTMSGNVAVPVTVSSQRMKVRSRRPARTKRGQRRGRRKVRTVSTVTMRWALDPPAQGLAFDVHRRLPGGEWGPLASGTTAQSGTFRTRPGRVWEIRARLRNATDAERATDWSPTTTVTG